MKARWLFGIMATILAVVVTRAPAQQTDTGSNDAQAADNGLADADGSIALAEHFSTYAHITLRQKELPQKALALDAALYRAALKLNKDEPRYARALSDVLLEMNDIPGAMDALKHYLSLEPADQTAQIQLIDLYLASDRMQSLEDRLVYLRHLLQVEGIPDPVKSEVAYRAAQLRMERGEQPEALKLLDAARRLNPMNLTALRERYYLTQEKALPSDRVSQLLGILQANPADPVVCSRLAEQLAQLGLVDTAVVWYGQANGLYGATGAPADPAFVLGASSELLIAKMAEKSLGLAQRYNTAVPDDADGWFVTLSVLKFQLAQYSDETLQAKYTSTMKMAGIAIANRIEKIRKLAGDTSATTRPVDSPDDTVLSDLSSDDTRFKPAQYRELLAPYKATLTSLAWLDLYYKHDVASAVPIIDDLERLSASGDATVKRLRAWQQYVAGDSSGALTKLQPLAPDDPLAGLGVALIQLKDPATAPKATVLAQRLLDDHPSGVIGAVLWAEFGHLGLKVDPAPSSGPVATLVANVPNAYLDLATQPKNFYDIEVTPLKPTFDYGEPILVRVFMQNTSNIDLAIGDDAAIHPTLWFDARFRNMQMQNIFGAAVGRLDQRLVLAPGDSVSTVVRVDQDALHDIFSGNPAYDLLLDLNLVTNPVGISTDPRVGTVQARPGVCGYSVPSSELIGREPVPIATADQINALYARLNADDGGEKIRTMQAITAYTVLLQSAKTKEGQQLCDDFISQLHRVDPGGRIPVLAFQKFESVAVAQPDDRVALIAAMTTDSHWQCRMLGLIATNALGAKGVPIASQLANDSDPIVRDYANALTASLQAIAATQPSESSPPPPQTSQTP